MYGIGTVFDECEGASMATVSISTFHTGYSSAIGLTERIKNVKECQQACSAFLAHQTPGSDNLEELQAVL